MGEINLLSAEECKVYDAKLRVGIRQYKKAADKLRNALYVAKIMTEHYQKQRKKVRNGEARNAEASVYGGMIDYDAHKTPYKLAQELLRKMR